MSRLPNAAQAFAETGKVRDYILNSAHPGNRGKAKLFQQFGFVREHWQVLAAALCGHVVSNEVLMERPSPYGAKFVVQCKLKSPDGRDPCIRSIWIIQTGELVPRLVTAY